MNQAILQPMLVSETAPGEAPVAPHEPPESVDAGFGFNDFLSLLVSQRFFILGVIAVSVVVGLMFAWQMKPIYSATAQIALGAQSMGELARPGQAAPLAPDTAVIQSEIALLTSNDLMSRLISVSGPGKVADELGLRSPERFEKAAAGSEAHRDLVQQLQRKLTIVRVDASHVISVTFRTPSAAASVRLANSLVDVYLNAKMDERRDAARRASDWLDERVKELRADVQVKEDAVARYREQTRLLSVGGDRDSSLNEQQFFELQDRVVAARADLVEKQARLAQVQRVVATGATADSLPETLNSASIQALRTREAEVTAREAEFLQRYGDKHPTVLQVQREHQNVLDQIQAEIQRIQTSQAHEVDVARARLTELQQGLYDLESALVDGNRALVRLRELERDAASAVTVYQDHLTRAREIAEQESLKVIDARQISRALEPDKPSSASPKMWIAFFTAAGVLLAIILAIIRAIINDRIVRPEDIARRLRTTPLVSIPLIHRRQLRKLPPDERTPEDFLVSQPMTAFAESLRVLNTALMSVSEGHGALAVAVTSAVPAEGKTTVSMSLGRVAAMSGLRVLIIDCDARRPSLSAGVGEKPVISLIDVIARNTDWREAAVPDATTPALVLPINASGGQIQTLFRPETLRQLLNTLRPEFDLIVMDCPPILAVAETRWLVSAADQTLIVTQWNSTRTSAVRTALREIVRARARVAGVTLNRTDVAVARQFSFSDSLYYGAAGRGYYTR